MESITKRNVKHSLYFLVILVPLLLVTCVSAGETNSGENLNPRITHEIILEGFSWEAISMECNEGVVLSGSFLVTCE